VFWPVRLGHLLISRSPRTILEDLFDEGVYSDSSFEKSLTSLLKELEQKIVPVRGTVPLFIWRDVVSRYSGLSAALLFESVNPNPEILRITQNDVQTNQRICLARRNRLLLRKHRSQARQDYLKTLCALAPNAPDPQAVFETGMRFCDLLRDGQASESISVISREFAQTETSISVKELERRTWIPQEQ
jgi:hypothetical protein